jgi:hypothetical protein
MFVLFHPPHTTRLEAIALTGNHTVPRGSLQFIIEDLHNIKENPMEGKWHDLPIVKTTFPTPKASPPTGTVIFVF